MLKNNIINSLLLIKNMIINPAVLFRNISKEENKFAVYFLFLLSGVITFLKSFSVKKVRANFYPSEIINEIISFFIIPQIQWIITFFTFILFILLTRRICQFLLKRLNKMDLTMCFLSISSIGILLQILFGVLQYFLSQEWMHILRHIAFLWVICLSIIAIKNSQNTTYMKSFKIYIFSAFPLIFVSGLPGLAPFLLWLM